MSKLVLAEKPSVAQALSKVLGATRRGDGYLEGNGYVVSWCVGHLVELAPPEVYGDQYKKWCKEDLPIFCNQRTPTDGFAEQNGRDAERADLTCRY